MISDEAVEAALKESGGPVMAVMNERAMVRRILEAAAPYMQTVVTTQEELDALPVGSIIAMIGSMPDSPAVACRAVRGWQFLGDDPERRYSSSSLIPSPEPITVLHAPNPYSSQA